MKECWIWKDNCVEEVFEDYFGFIYLIINKLDNKIYVGKKQFSFNRKVKLSKKAQLGTRKKKEIKKIDSGWKNYWGSSKSLLEDIKEKGKENFTREILAFARSKTELSYLELVFQIEKNVMFLPSYNGWISARIYKNNLNKENDI